jgi:hypothetical protein
MTILFLINKLIKTSAVGDSFVTIIEYSGRRTLSSG